MWKFEVLKLSAFLICFTPIVSESETSEVNPVLFESDKNQTLENVSNLEPPINKLRIRKTEICTKGYVHNIVDGASLYDLETNLECLLYAGLPLSKVPEGSFNGKLLAVIDTPILNPLLDFIWKGKTIVHVNCPIARNDLFYGYNNFFNHPLVPFVAYLGKLEANLMTGEHTDDKMSLILDYSKNFKNPCQTNAPTNEYDATAVQNDYFWYNLLDVIRLVGRQPDGGAILMGKTFFKDPRGLSSTILYFYLVNYDPLLNPDFKSADPLPPLEASFAYTIPGL